MGNRTCEEEEGEGGYEAEDELGPVGVGSDVGSSVIGNDIDIDGSGTVLRGLEE